MVNISVESHSVEIRDELIGLLKNISLTPKGIYICPFTKQYFDKIHDI